MAETILDGNGSGYRAGVNSDNQLLVDTSNTLISGTVPISGGVHSEEKYKTAISYSGAVQLYIGKAIPGSEKSAEAWQIQRLSYSGYNVTDIEFAGESTAFDKAWNNRVEFTYG